MDDARLGRPRRDPRRLPPGHAVARGHTPADTTMGTTTGTRTNRDQGDSVWPRSPSGGILPSPSALIALLAAVAIGRLVFGLAWSWRSGSGSPAS